MGLDVASSAGAFFLFSAAELIFIAIPMIVFKLQKKDLKYEFRHRIIPNEMLNRNFWFRLADIIMGIFIGVSFYYFGGLLANTIRKVIIQIMGQDFYNTAAEGSVNTTPPPPPPDPLIIWTLIIIGVIVIFITVAFAEEFCFRGVLLKEFNHKNKVFGVILSSFLFMLFHVMPGIVPWSTFLTFWLYYFSFGVLLSLVTIFQKGDLIVSIIAHGTFNSVIWIVRYVGYL
ncbi:MAG: lysostaphin resistance A-like protein [Promethearchaeota archaeon]